jgi:hypothetical protein
MLTEPPTVHLPNRDREGAGASEAAIMNRHAGNRTASVGSGSSQISNGLAVD